MQLTVLWRTTVVGIHNLGQPQFSIDWHCDVKLSPPQKHGKFSEASLDVGALTSKMNVSPSLPLFAFQLFGRRRPPPPRPGNLFLIHDRRYTLNVAEEATTLVSSLMDSRALDGGRA